MATNQLWVRYGAAAYVVGEVQQLTDSARVRLYQEAARAFMHGTDEGRAIDKAIGHLMTDLGLVYLEVEDETPKRISVRYR